MQEFTFLGELSATNTNVTMEAPNCNEQNFFVKENNYDAIMLYYVTIKPYVIMHYYVIMQYDAIVWCDVIVDYDVIVYYDTIDFILFKKMFPSLCF